MSLFGKNKCTAKSGGVACETVTEEKSNRTGKAFCTSCKTIVNNKLYNYRAALGFGVMAIKYH